MDKKRILSVSFFLIIYLSLLTGFNFVSAAGTQYICLRNRETIYFSECKSNIDDYVCSGEKCQLCVNEIEQGVYCPANPANCNDACVYLYDTPEEENNDPIIETPVEDSSVVVLLGPDNEYSLEETQEIVFSFKVASRFNVCELVLDGEIVASKNRPIMLNRQYNLNYLVEEEGVHRWRIDCTRMESDGGNIILSETRSLLVGDAEVLNANSIALTSPVQGYSVQGEQAINFSFDIAGDLSRIGQCNLVLNSETYDMGLSEINAQNTYSKTIPVGEYSWNVECLDNGKSLVSELRSLIITSAPAPSGGGGGGGGGSSGSSGGGSGGGGGGSGLNSLYSLTEKQFEGGASKILTKGSRIRVTIADEAHYIKLDEVISATSAKISVFSEPQTFVLNIGNEKKIDADNDNFYDFVVSLKSIIGSKADISVKKISESIMVLNPETENLEDITQEDSEENIRESNVGAGITGGVIGVIANNKIKVAVVFITLLLIGILASYSYQKKKQISD